MIEHPMNSYLRNFGKKINCYKFNCSNIDYTIKHNISNKRMNIELKYKNSLYENFTDLQRKIYIQQHYINKEDTDFTSSYLFLRDSFSKTTDVIEIAKLKENDKLIITCNNDLDLKIWIYSQLNFSSQNFVNKPSDNSSYFPTGQYNEFESLLKTFSGIEILNSGLIWSQTQEKKLYCIIYSMYNIISNNLYDSLSIGQYNYLYKLDRLNYKNNEYNGLLLLGFKEYCGPDSENFITNDPKISCQKELDFYLQNLTYRI